MQDEPRYKPLAASDFFSDHRSARPMVEGTVARGHLRIDEARYTGKINGEDIDQFPIPIAKADIERGQTRFNIYCTPCHGRLGDGNGMVVLRGFRPASVLLHRAPHERARGPLLRRDHQRIRRHAELRLARGTGRPLANHGLYPRAAIERIGQPERRPRRSAPESARGTAAAHGRRKHGRARRFTPQANPQGGNQ